MNIVIIGGGQAAVSCAEKLRSLSDSVSITIAGDEVHLPYERPPLSKGYLAGDVELEDLYFHPENWYVENQIELMTNSQVVAIDRDGKTIATNAGNCISYDKLVFATGARARTLSESSLENAKGVYSIRSISDIEAVRHEFQLGRKLTIVGGGYIGLEAAAIARRFDVKVTLIEAAPRILGRVASQETADFIRSLHTDHGVDILENQGIESYIIKNGCIDGVRLSNGSTIGTDFLIVGIGIIPNCEVAEAAGIVCDRGILVNEFCQTNDLDVFAIGDCSRFEYNSELISIESVGNAIDQGQHVADMILGDFKRYQPKPWFWSDQYDVALQIAGLNTGFTDTVIRRGPREDSMSVWYYRDDEPIAIDAINDPRTYVLGKRIIENNKALPKEIAKNPESNLKKWL